MKKPAIFCLSAFILAANSGCEQQEYKDTKMFNQSSHVGGHEHGAAKSGEHQPEHKVEKP